MVVWNTVVRINANAMIALTITAAMDLTAIPKIVNNVDILL